MDCEVIGVGRMGSGIAYSLFLLGKGLSVSLNEPFKGNQTNALAEYYDLLPVAEATGNKVSFNSGRNGQDCFIVCSGLPRTHPNQNKLELFNENVKIVESVVERVPKYKPLFVVSNPPVEIAAKLLEKGFTAVPLRGCTDNLRLNYGLRDSNSFVLRHKGFTQWTPAFACAKEVLRYMREKV